MKSKRALSLWLATGLAAVALFTGCAPTRPDYLRDVPLSKPNYGHVPVIRVLIVPKATNGDDVTIEVSGACRIYRYKDMYEYQQRNSLEKSRVAVSENSVFLGNKVYPSTAIEIVPEVRRGSHCIVNGVSYDGNISVIATGKDRFKVVNALDLESYLKGVVASEVFPSWPPAALRAQAVAARTYAIYKMETVSDPDYDVVSSVKDQAYQGRARRFDTVDRAVDDTFSIVLSAHGRLFPAQFHSCDGGYTEDIHHVWPTNKIPDGFAPLAGRDTSQYLNSPHMAWKKSYSARAIQDALRKKGYDVQGIQQIQPADVTRSGRPKTIVVTHAGGTTRIPSNAFRLAVGGGAAGLRSTRFTVHREGDNFLFIGSGFGHGVGMSQYGCREMAEAGKNSLEILDFYYPTAKPIRVYQHPK